MARAPACGIDLTNVADTIVATWRQVQSRGFSLCIPRDWRILRRPTLTGDPYGRGAWRGNESSFQWRFAPGTMMRQCGVPIRLGEQTWYETIGGEEVCVILSLRTVRAYWDDGLVMAGAGADGLVVDRLLSVIRTVRLLASPPPPGVDRASPGPAPPSAVRGASHGRFSTSPTD